MLKLLILLASLLTLATGLTKNSIWLVVSDVVEIKTKIDKSWNRESLIHSINFLVVPSQVRLRTFVLNSISSSLTIK